MTTPDMQLWQSLLVFSVLIAAVAAQSLSALKARARVAGSGSAVAVEAATA